MTTDLKSLAVSKVADLLVLTKEPEPKMIADAILNIDLKPREVIYSRIEELDKEFRKDLLTMIRR